ncbi:MAG: peptide-methionine (S)-S-oxide reductase MsrA [Methanomicrobiales archaeon]|nr:peptide-methionine (S)-S-oxide reductase MsrA [Methanomicrobiales archaeon]
MGTGEGADRQRGEKETAYFAAGCFWGVQAAFDTVAGVISTAVGYMGGRTANPTYHDVCTGTTGHAETVQVIFDPADADYTALLEIFWSIHDPTTKNRQGPDVGSQYRSVIFFATPEQEAVAKRSRDAIEQRLGRAVATEIVPAGAFWRAEEYHQHYFRKQGRGGCRL